MPLFQRLSRILWHWLERTPPWVVGVIILGHFLISWAFMQMAEPEAEFVRADTFWWFYIVTTTTVGYGDFSPATFGGRMTGAFVMFFGIMMIAGVLGKIATFAVDIADKRRRGLMTYSGSDHTIVVGDGSRHTIVLLQNLIADSTVGDVVLVSEGDENPLNGTLAGFVSGRFEDGQVQDRAGFARAKRILVLGDNDIVVTGRAIDVMDCSGPETEILVYFQHEDASAKLNKHTDSRVRTVSSVSMDLLVQEALDPGAADFVSRLTKNHVDATYLRLQVPADVDCNYTEIDTYLLGQAKVNVISYYQGNEVTMIPDAQHPAAGLVLAVIAHSREQLDAIDWTALQST